MNTILFDIDKTLFDTPKFYQLIFPALIKASKINQQDFEHLVDEYYQGITDRTEFDPENFLRLLAEKTQADYLELTKIFWNPEFFKQALYLDALEVLEKLKNSFRLGAFTQAVIPWQEKKLKLSGLINYFEPELIFISPHKTDPELIAKLPAATIIDDKIKFLAPLKKYGNKFRLIWINREDAQENKNFETIYKLKDLLSLLQ